MFAEKVEQINRDVLGSDLRLDSLLEAPAYMLHNIVSTGFYDSVAVKKMRERNEASSVCCQRGPHKEDMRQALLHADEWDKIGSDYEDNPNMIEDDFIRDDGFGLIAAEDYEYFRLLPLIQYYNHRAPQLCRIVNVLQCATFFFTAVITAAPALGQEIWVPFFVNVIAAIQSMSDFEHFSSQLTNVNGALEKTKNLRVWWQSLSMVERRMLQNKDILVSGTESAMDAEICSWKKLDTTGKPQTHKGQEQQDDNKDGE